jgi:CubicO group peptidase (beta-lactamase class C family)
MQRTLDLDVLTPPEEAGMRANRVAEIHAVFERWWQVEPGAGAQLVVLRRGRKVVDANLGVHLGEPIHSRSRFLIFSCTKAFTVACIYRLIDTGLVDLDAPIAEYWPAFGMRGKGSATIAQVLSHHAGLPSYGMYASIPLWPFWRLIAAFTAFSPAQYPPGDHFAYHVVTFGWILGEVLRRVTGQRIESYFHEQFAAPLGMTDTTLKLPREELTTIPKVISGCKDMDGNAVLFNLDVIRQAVVPAGGAHSTARDMALFFQMLLNGGEYAGRRYIAKETLDHVLQPYYEGLDHGVNRTVRYALGLHLGGERDQVRGDPSPTMGVGSTGRTFGHAGNRSCYVWADRDAELVFAYTTNYLLNWHDHKLRWKELADAVWNALD